MIKDQLAGYGRRVWREFSAFSPGQKAVTVVAVLAMLVGGYVLLTWKPKAQYAPLYTNLAAADASAISDKLTAQKIPYQLADGGAEIMVPTADVDSARLAVSAAGLPNSGQTGYALLDKEGVTTSQFQQQVDFQRATEGELAKTIESIDGVQAASVHLAIPQQDVFNDGSSKPTAAVLLTTSPAATLATTQVQSIVYLVSSSVQGMSASDVTVTDSNGDVLSAPGSGVTDSVSANSQMQAEQSYSKTATANLQAMLDRAVGVGHAAVTVNASLNPASSKTTRNSYIYKKNTPPVSESSTKETYTGAGAGGAAGTLGATDTSGTTTNGQSGSGNYNKTDRTVNNADGTEREDIDNPAGQLKNLHIAVLLDKSMKNLDIPAITRIVRSSTGYLPSRGDSLSVQAVPFDNTAQNAAAASAKSAVAAAAAKASQAHLVSLAKQGLLALLIIGIAVGAWLSARKRRARDAPPDPNDDGLGLIGDLDPSGDDQATQLPVMGDDSQDPLLNRRHVSTAVDNRPNDVAEALSGWLTPKENHR